MERLMMNRTARLMGLGTVLTTAVFVTSVHLAQTTTDAAASESYDLLVYGPTFSWSPTGSPLTRTNYTDLVDLLTNPASPMQVSKVLVEVNDPTAFADNFQLGTNTSDWSSQCNLIRFMHALEDPTTIGLNGRTPYTGIVGLKPAFDSGGWANYTPPDPDICSQNFWRKSIYWAKEANDRITALGGSLLFTELVLDTESAAIPKDTSALCDANQYANKLWSQENTDGTPISISIILGYHGISEMADWTTGETGCVGIETFCDGQPAYTYAGNVAAAVYLEIYNLTEPWPTANTPTAIFVDAYGAGVSLPNPCPTLNASVTNTIYQQAIAGGALQGPCTLGAGNLPSDRVLGQFDTSNPEATIGFMLAWRTQGSESTLQGKDLSKCTMLFSNEALGSNFAIINAFGTWNGVGTNPGFAEFDSFTSKFLSGFDSYYTPTANVRPGIFEYRNIPECWFANPRTTCGTGDPGCIGDFNNDGWVRGEDLALFLGAWGACAEKGTCITDLSDDGTTDGEDLAIFLSNWGACR